MLGSLKLCETVATAGAERAQYEGSLLYKNTYGEPSSGFVDP